MLSPKTYSRIIKEQSDSIFNFLNKNLKDRASAEDLTQECFLKLWKNSLFLKEEIVRSWLFKTAYHLMLNHLRDNKKIDYQSDFLENQSCETPRKLEQKDLIDKIFSNLNAEQRSILVLRDQEEYSYKEIAKILSVSEDNVKVKLFRARARFKELYELVNKEEKILRYE